MALLFWRRDNIRKGFTESTVNTEQLRDEVQDKAEDDIIGQNKLRVVLCCERNRAKKEEKCLVVRTNKWMKQKPIWEIIKTQFGYKEKINKPTKAINTKTVGKER